MLRAAVSSRALISSLRGPSLPASHMLTRSVSRSVTCATAGGAGAPTNVRLVTYNVLSSHLGGADHFRNCAPEDLVPTTRLSRLLAKLEPEVSQGSLICLQEVSMTWSGAYRSGERQRTAAWRCAWPAALTTSLPFLVLVSSNSLTLLSLSAQAR